MKIPYPFTRTRVKICGFTQPGDALAAARLGADALGLVFYPPSPRHVTPAQARAIVAAIPPFVTVVALFVDPSPGEVAAVLGEVPVGLIQFHGDEEPGFCEGFGMPYIKAIRMRPDANPVPVMAAHERAAGFLLDAWHADAKGGTGQCFDWSLIPADRAGSIILAGGLEPANVAGALAAIGPYAVDVSSGVESARGIKDVARMAAFLREVQQFDHRHHVEPSLQSA